MKTETNSILGLNTQIIQFNIPLQNIQYIIGNKGKAANQNLRIKKIKGTKKLIVSNQFSVTFLIPRTHEKLQA